MEVILAESAGFCFGVQRAVDKVYEQIEKSELNIFTYGPIIHNKFVVEDFEKKGVVCLNDESEIKKADGGVMVIRSHGAQKRIYETAEKNNVRIVDATCPFVKKIHRIVEKESSEGRHIVVIGDKTHPEVQGIIGWSSGPTTVVGNEDDAEKLKFEPKTQICVVSQTTFNAQKFEYIVEIIQKKGYDTRVINTICNATALRQEEAAAISAKADKMIVIGDPQSSNTKKLYEICKSNCKDTYHIQTVKDLSSADLQSGSCVGITAGASTPNYIIQEVLFYVRGNYFQ